MNDRSLRGREVSVRPARPVLPLEGSPAYEAVETGLLRQIGLAAPEGRCDGAGRWWPASVERAGCCEAIRTPSRAFPWTPTCQTRECRDPPGRSLEGERRKST
jgi:hypothetical protein